MIACTVPGIGSGCNMFFLKITEGRTDGDEFFPHANTGRAYKIHTSSGCASSDHLTLYSTLELPDDEVKLKATASSINKLATALLRRKECVCFQAENQKRPELPLMSGSCSGPFTHSPFVHAMLDVCVCECVCELGVLRAPVPPDPH